MKTSSKLLIVAVLILFGTMVMYDFALKAEYKKGTYKDARYQTLGYKNFNTIEIRSANMFNVEISQSDTFDVKVEKEIIMDNLKISQEGTNLIIAYDAKKPSENWGIRLKISCPLLRQLSSDAVVIVNGKPVISAWETDYNGYRTYAGYAGIINIKGFVQDSLILKVDNLSSVAMSGTRIGYLKTDIGHSQSSRSGLKIDGSNQIGSADINLQNNSKLELYDMHIGNLKTKISDSAEVHLRGASLKLIR